MFLELKERKGKPYLTKPDSERICYIFTTSLSFLIKEILTDLCGLIALTFPMCNILVCAISFESNINKIVKSRLDEFYFNIRVQ